MSGMVEKTERFIRTDTCGSSSRPGERVSTEGRIHLRRLSLRPTSTLLQSGGGPYIIVNYRLSRNLSSNPGLFTIRGFLDNNCGPPCGGGGQSDQFADENVRYAAVKVLDVAQYFGDSRTLHGVL